MSDLLDSGSTDLFGQINANSVNVDVMILRSTPPVSGLAGYARVSGISAMSKNLDITMEFGWPPFTITYEGRRGQYLSKQSGRHRNSTTIVAFFLRRRYRSRVDVRRTIRIQRSSGTALVGSIDTTASVWWRRQIEQQAIARRTPSQYRAPTITQNRHDKRFDLVRPMCLPGQTRRFRPVRSCLADLQYVDSCSTLSPT